MPFKNTPDYARKADARDPLRKFRKQFHFPGNGDHKAVYLCGNSLGLQARNVKKAVTRELEDWKTLAVGGYLHARNPWLYYQHYFKRSLSAVVGCNEEEVTVMNTLTVNLHLLMVSFYKPVPQRYKVIMEAGAFPSDQYAVQTQVALHGFPPDESIIEIAPRAGEKLLRTEDIVQVIRNNSAQVALVLFGGINYYTGQLYDIKAITEAAHEAGAIAGFDLAHVAGNVPVYLHEWNVDFAAWCSYKYLNGGPGSAGGVYIHEKWAQNTFYPRLGGWWGNEEKTRFNMEKHFVPQPGADGWNISTAQIFNMVALKAALEWHDKAGIENIRYKSLLLTGYLEYLLGTLKHLPFELITPADPLQRGAQLSLFFREQGKAIHHKMTEAGIVVDYREPGVIRVSPSPLYNSFEDVYRFYKVLKKC
jgi:kynureninase